MILYHGSREIVKYPEIRKAQYHKDFYFGFYCTKLPNQAKRWASRYGIKGYLNSYEYTPNYELKYLIFEEMSEEWLDFIYVLLYKLTILHFFIFIKPLFNIVI